MLCSDRPPLPKAIPIIERNVHIWSCFIQSCIHARGEISDTPSDILLFKKEPQTTNRSFPAFLSFSLPPFLASFPCLLSSPPFLASFPCLFSLPPFLAFCFPLSFLFLSSTIPCPFLFRSFSFPLPFLSFSLRRFVKIDYKSMCSEGGAPKERYPFGGGELGEDHEFWEQVPTWDTRLLFPKIQGSRLPQTKNIEVTRPSFFPVQLDTKWSDLYHQTHTMKSVSCQHGINSQARSSSSRALVSRPVRF